MNRTPTNIFAPRIAEPRNALTVISGTEVTALAQETRRSGGWLAGWRIRRAADAGNVALAEHALEEILAARQQEMTLRVAYALDVASKRALAMNVTETAVIEREITQMTADAVTELKRLINIVDKQGALEEMRDLRDIEGQRTRGEITERSYNRLKESIIRRTDQAAEQAESVAAKVIENLGARLGAALQTTQGGR